MRTIFRRICPARGIGGAKGSTHPIPCCDLPVGRFLDRAVESYFGFSEKYFGSHSPQITSRPFRIPPHQRGVARSSRTRGGVRWTRQRFARDGIAGRVGERRVSNQQRADERCLQRTAKSCSPDAPTLASSSRSCVGPTGLRQSLNPLSDGGKQARSQEHEGNR